VLYSFISRTHCLVFEVWDQFWLHVRPVAVSVSYTGWCRKDHWLLWLKKVPYTQGDVAIRSRHGWIFNADLSWKRCYRTVLLPVNLQDSNRKSSLKICLVLGLPPSAIISHAKYCDQHVPLHISRTTLPNFAQFSVHVTCSCGSVLFWRQCYTSCTSRFVDDVIFSYNVGNRPESKNMYVSSSCQVAAPVRQRCLVEIVRWWHRVQSLPSLTAFYYKFC